MTDNASSMVLIASLKACLATPRMEGSMSSGDAMMSETEQSVSTDTRGATRAVWILAALSVMAACAGTSTIVSGTALVGVSIIDLETGGLESAMTVVVDGSRITHVAPTGAIRLGGEVRRIDLDGMYVVPGLWDMHAHTWADEEARAVFLPAFIAQGVTGIRDMFADCDSLCAGGDARSLENLAAFRHPSASMVQSWIEDIAAGRQVGPRIIRSSFIIAGGDSERPLPVWPGSRLVDGVEEARNAVLESADHGVDFIKIYPDLDRDEFFEIARVADSLGLRLSGHVSYAVSPAEAAASGMDSFEHGLRLAEFCVRKPGPADAGIEQWALPDRLRNLGDPQACLATFASMASNNVYLVPTLTAMRAMTSMAHSDAADPRRRYLPAYIARLWQRYLDPVPPLVLDGASAIHDAVAALLPVAMDAGVSILAGSDTPNPFVYPGDGLHAELEELVGAGLSPLDALRAATVLPARYLDRDAELGAVAPGFLADLVVLSKSPLENIRGSRSIELVVSNGRVFTRVDLDRLLANIERYAEGG